MHAWHGLHGRWRAHIQACDGVFGVVVKTARACPAKVCVFRRAHKQELKCWDETAALASRVSGKSATLAASLFDFRAHASPKNGKSKKLNAKDKAQAAANCHHHTHTHTTHTPFMRAPDMSMMSLNSQHAPSVGEERRALARRGAAHREPRV